jgi:gamma-glutamyltranspeptidase/glutathione hydrolase
MQMLNLAEHFDLRQEPRWSPRTMHLMIESMRQAYYNRARFLGDPDFVEIPVKLTTKEFAAELAKTISLDQARSSAELGKEILTPDESSQTTHFSVIDRDGMAVSNTYTLEISFGSVVVVRGGGFLLNDEMGDFNPQPGVTAADGRIGTPANLVAPGKRMLSSMCPTIVARDGKPVLITGSPGGRTIINTLFCVLVNVLEYDLPLRDAVDAPRHHHQWMPDRMQIESALLADHLATIERLRAMGHTIQERAGRQGDAHSIAVDPTTGSKLGVADRRLGGWAAGEK